MDVNNRQNETKITIINRRKHTANNKLTSLIEIFLTISILTSVVIDQAILGYVSLLFGIVLAIFDARRLFPYYFLVSMATDLFTGALGGGLPRLFGVLLLLSAIIRNHEKLILDDLLSLLFILISTLISYGLSSSKTTLYLMSMILNLLIVFTVINMRFSKADIDIFIKKILSLFSVFVILSAVIMLVDPYISFRGGKTAYSLTKDVNSNTLAQMMVQISMFFISYLSIKGRSDLSLLKRIFIRVITLMSLILLFLTGSRSGLFGIMMGSILLIAFGKYYKRSIVKIVLIVLIFLCIGYIVILYFPILGERFDFISIIESGGSGRMSYIEVEMKYIIPNNLFFGVGIGTTSEVAALAPYFKYQPLSATNIIFSMLTQVGLIGFVAFWAYFIKISYCVMKGRLIDTTILIPGLMFFAAIFQGIGENIFYERYLWNVIALICVCFTYSKNYKQNNRRR